MQETLVCFAGREDPMEKGRATHSSIPGVPWWLSEESTCNVGHLGSGLGRFPRGRHGNPLQHPCWRTPMDSGAWRATVDGVTESGAKPSDYAQRSRARFVCVLSPVLSCNPMGSSPPRGSSVRGTSSGKNAGVGCHFLLQSIFLTKGSNLRLPCLLLVRWALYH